MMTRRQPFFMLHFMSLGQRAEISVWFGDKASNALTIYTYYDCYLMDNVFIDMLELAREGQREYSGNVDVHCI